MLIPEPIDGKIPPRPDHVTGEPSDCPHCLHELVYEFGNVGDEIDERHKQRVERFNSYTPEQRSRRYWMAYQVGMANEEREYASSS